jgi:hypothetical protein
LWRVPSRKNGLAEWHTSPCRGSLNTAPSIVVDVFLEQALTVKVRVDDRLRQGASVDPRLSSASVPINRIRVPANLSYGVALDSASPTRSPNPHLDLALHIHRHRIKLEPVHSLRFGLDHLAVYCNGPRFLCRPEQQQRCLTKRLGTVQREDTV